jgi:hypothetical protein
MTESWNTVQRKKIKYASGLYINEKKEIQDAASWHVYTHARMKSW